MKRSEMKDLLVRRLESVKDTQKTMITRNLQLHFQKLEADTILALCMLNEWEPEDD